MPEHNHGNRASADEAATVDRPSSGPMPTAPISVAPVEGPGAKIGPYKLLQLIGEGGFGSVFMAEQEQPVRRRVALKIIKWGMDTRQVIARFEAERQALALMDHPNIARVLDAGATDAGRPFFVMELCTGEPITEFCDKNSLPIAARLDLFVQVCRAVQHAHQKGIIHRDIKPSNVLVSSQDGRPLAKVIDFGIAKATASRLTEKTLFTEHRQLIGTPEYMSPEQADGSLDIDTRTDVYALGVMLYELLTGTTPFAGTDLRSAAFGEFQRIIREVDPPRPSTRLSQSAPTLASIAARRRTEPHRLGTMLRGELDWIVMKAMEKDRARRYDSANGLGADVGRYLGGEAVLAAPPGRLYRARKFVRRHRGSVVAATLVAAALVLGVIGTSVGFVRAHNQMLAATAARKAESAQRGLAETRLAESEATVKFLDDMLGAADPMAQGKDVTVRQVLDRAAGSVGSQFADRPLVAARLHGTIGRTYMELGDLATAEPHFKEMLAISRGELGEDNRETRRALNAMGVFLIKKGAHAEAEVMLKKAIADNERLFGRSDEATLESMEALATLYMLQTRPQDAAPLTKEILDTRIGRLGPAHLDTLTAMNTLGMTYADMGKFDDAERLLENAVAQQAKAAGDSHASTLQFRSNLALVEYSAAMETRESDPAGSKRRMEMALSLGESTLRDRERVLGAEHPDTLSSMNNLSSVYKELGRWDDADRLALRDIEVSVKVLGETHPDTITSIANMGNSLRNRRRFDEAVKYLDRALKNARTSMPPDAPGTGFILGWYGSCLRELGKFTDAEAMLLEAHGIIVKNFGEKHPVASAMALDLSRVYGAWDKADPGKGYDAKAAEWKAKADAARSAPKDAPPAGGQ